MFDVQEHLKDACKITALLLPGNQNAKYKFSPGAKYGNKNRENIVTMKLK